MVLIWYNTCYVESNENNPKIIKNHTQCSQSKLPNNQNHPGDASLRALSLHGFVAACFEKENIHFKLS